jgi:hypothetical protein
MSGDLIRNVRDPHFQSLLQKLLDAGWLEKVVESHSTATSKTGFEFVWSVKGQLCLLTIKRQMNQSALWGESKAFVASLNEQEEAFFHENILSDAPP